MMFDVLFLLLTDSRWLNYKLCTYSCFASSSIDFNVFHNILHNPKISHEWFKVGLALSIAIMSLKAYVELYEGKTRNKKVEYENFKTATHITIFLIMGAWISFHMALSPVYGGFKTWIVMVGFSYGVLIQSSLFIPVWGQNFLSVVVMTVFLQQYKWFWLVQCALLKYLWWRWRFVLMKMQKEEWKKSRSREVVEIIRIDDYPLM